MDGRLGKLIVCMFTLRTLMITGCASPNGTNWLSQRPPTVGSLPARASGGSLAGDRGRQAATEGQVRPRSGLALPVLVARLHYRLIQPIA